MYTTVHYISGAMPALEFKHVIVTNNIHVNCLKGCKGVHNTNTVKPEFYDTTFYDHLSYMTSFSGTDDL